MRLGLLQAPRRTRAEARARLEGIYERFTRTAERRRQMGTTLSGGVQQMPMAGVLAGSPKLLLRNESTEGLTPMFVNGLFELMAGLAREGIPIVLVEQTVRRAIALAHASTPSNAARLSRRDGPTTRRAGPTSCVGWACELAQHAREPCRVDQRGEPMTISRHQQRALMLRMKVSWPMASVSIVAVVRHHARLAR